MDQVLAAFVGGGVSVAIFGFVGDWLRDRRVNSREREARAAQRELDRNAFQRQTLLELQVALDALTTTSTDVFIYLLNSSVGQPDLGFAAPSPELQQRTDRVRLLSSRVLDESVRDLVNRGIAQLATFPIRSSKGEAHGTLTEGNGLLGDAMLRCGEITRGLW